MSTTNGGASAPRRQDRGRRRIEAILDTAAGVFADAGYAAATTNAIADRAGISPGSLYQYFANKDAIAAALEDRYARLVQRAREEAGAASPDGSLEEAVSRLVAAIVSFGTATEGFHALFAERRMPEHVSASTHELHQAMVGWVESILDAHGGSRSPDERRRTTLVSVQLCRALVPLIVAAEGDEREALVGELRRALVGYLAQPVA